MKHLVFTLTLVTGLLTQLTGQYVASAANMPLDHPDVVAIHEIYQSVEKAIARSGLKKTVAQCGDLRSRR